MHISIRYCYCSQRRGQCSYALWRNCSWEVSKIRFDFIHNKGFICITESSHFIISCQFPLKAAKVMHTVSLRTEATIVGAQTPPNLGQAFKVTVVFSHQLINLCYLLTFCIMHSELYTLWYCYLLPFFLYLQNHMSEMFAFHATMMSNTLGTSIVVFTRSGFMAILLSHYRPSGTIFAFTNEWVIRISIHTDILVV